MTLDAASILNGSANGTGLFIAPYGTTAPTDADSVLASGWDGVGYISEDEAPNIAQEITTQAIRAWQSASDVKKVITARAITLAFTMIEANPLSLSLYLSEAEPTPSAGEFGIALSSAPTIRNYAACLSVKDGDAYLRFYLRKVTL